MHLASTRAAFPRCPVVASQLPRGLAAKRPFWFATWDCLAWSAFQPGWLVFDLPFHTLGLGCPCGGNAIFMHSAALRLGIKTNGDPGRQEQGNSRPLKTNGLGPVTFPPRRASNSLPAAPLSFRSRLRNFHLSSSALVLCFPISPPASPLSDTRCCALDLDIAPTELEGSSNRRRLHL